MQRWEKIVNMRFWGLLSIVLMSFLIFGSLGGTSVFGDIIIDNGDAATSSTGTWSISGGSNPYGDDSIWARDGDSYTWNFGNGASGTYEVSMWWTQWPSRSTNVPIDVIHAGGTTRLYANQQVGGGGWNSLGEFAFTAGAGHKIVITSQAGPSSTCADAVWFKTVDSQEAIIIDNSDNTNTTRTGTWEVSGSSEYYGADSVWSRDGSSFSWLFNPPVSGNYKLSMWWTRWPSRSTTVPVDIQYAGGTDYVSINQQADGGQWNEIDTYLFNMGTTYKIMITAQPGPSSTCADAVKFDLVQGNSAPKAYIDSISPNPANSGQSVSFVGHGEDSDGTIKSYAWESSIDGTLSSNATFSKSDMSAGNHVITLRVTDNDNAVSAAVTANLIVNGASSEQIIDNRDSATSKTGTWDVSGASGYYGDDSVWSRDGATFTYRLSVPTTGNYDISMWWTQWPSRSTSVPVDIAYSGGTKRVTINQQANGSQWNSLGVYSLAANTVYNITITSQPWPTSTCADAIRCRASSSQPGLIANFTANQTRGVRPLTVQFSDESIGTISQWAWNFGDGGSSTSKNPSHTYSSAGSYTVSLKVTGSGDSDTETKAGYINVSASNSENIYLIDCFAGTPKFTQDTVKMLRNIGATDLGNESWRYQRAGMTYNIKFARNSTAAKAALKEAGSHIVIAGHANYGFGGIYATSKQILDARIDDFYSVDDDRMVNYCTDMVSTKVDGMKYGQAYPNWEPRYSNGQSALMPYTFAQGTPPYNYYLTYKIPGDSTNYRIELADGTYLERFPDSGVPAWYSVSGAKPDPVKNPEYFIVNNDPDFNRCSFVGSWPILRVEGGGYGGAAGYRGYNYQTHWPGLGGNRAIWHLVVNTPGSYRAYATWYADPVNASNAPYKINYAGGSRTVTVNQRTTDQLNLLGTFNFNKGSYEIELSDNANGYVVADSVMLNAASNPEKILQADFDTSVRSGSSPLTVDFSDRSIYYSFTAPRDGIQERLWNFGDGTTSTQRNPEHTYTKSGTYTVSLLVTDKSGAQSTEIKSRLINVGTSGPLEAEFTARGQRGFDTTVVTFKDLSSGNITSRTWDFGDGMTSTAQNPIHTYTQPGTYDVKLTVRNSSSSNTETKSDYVNNLIGSVYCDNADTTKFHFYSRSSSGTIFGKVICDMSSIRLKDSDMGYSRIFHGSCNSFPYFAGTMHRGIMFGKTDDVEVETFTESTYLEYYLLGYSDQEILDIVNDIEDIHEYYNFNLKPPSMR